MKPVRLGLSCSGSIGELLDLITRLFNQSRSHLGSEISRQFGFGQGVISRFSSFDHRGILISRELEGEFFSFSSNCLNRNAGQF